MKQVTTERVEELAEGLEILGLHNDAKIVRSLAKERDDLIYANKLMADDLVQRHDRCCALAEQLSATKTEIKQMDTLLALHGAEITKKNEELAAAQAVIAKKDKALSAALGAVRLHSHIADNFWWAKHIPYDNTTLLQLLEAQREAAGNLVNDYMGKGKEHVTELEQAIRTLPLVIDKKEIAK